MHQDFVRLDCRHNYLEQRWHDIRFYLGMTVFEAKEKLHKHGAGGVGTMELYLRKGNGETIFLYDDNLPLSVFGVENDMELFIKDTDEFSAARGGGYEDISLVEKYRMTDEEYDGYAAKTGQKTIRQYVKEKKAQDPNWKLKASNDPKKVAMDAEGNPIDPKTIPGGGGAGAEEERPATPTNIRELFPIGGRCEVNPGGRRGEIKYVGKVGAVKNGTMLGIALDEPQGMNDGTRSGIHYFDCKGENYGVFSRPENVNVGDYPEEDPFAGLSDDEDEI